jgi:hypothetical protein
MAASLKIDLAPHATTARVPLHRSHHISPLGEFMPELSGFLVIFESKLVAFAHTQRTEEPLCFDSLSHTSVTDLQAPSNRTNHPPARRFAAPDRGRSPSRSRSIVHG